MLPKPADAVTAEVCALFGTSALKYIAYADRLKKTDAYWKLKIACTMKGSTKRPTMVSVCLVRMSPCLLIIRPDALHSC